MDDIKLKVEYISIDDLKPYERNAKLHPQKQIDQIARSIKEYGMNDPIGVWKDNVIIEGHGRLEACKKLGIDTVPIVRLDHLTDEQRREYTLIHNKTTMNSDFDTDMLDFEIKELNNFDAEFYDFQFDIDDEVPEIVEDEVPEEVETRCKLGDIYQLGEHRLICGDSTDPEVIKNLTGGSKDIDLYITDPPYNVDYEGGTKDALKIMNDKMDNESFRLFLRGAFTAANEVLRPGAVFYIWHADSEGYNFRGACFDIGWKIRQAIIWVKNSIVLGRQDYQWKHEPCLYGWKDGASHFFVDSRTEATVIEDKIDINKLTKEQMKTMLKEMLSDKQSTTVMHEDKPQRNGEHPTMKPVKLIGREIKNSTRPGNKVLDSFGGSGTTLIACEQLGRKAFLCELDPHYCDVIIQRWENLTGKQAILMTEGSNETGS